MCKEKRMNVIHKYYILLRPAVTLYCFLFIFFVLIVFKLFAGFTLYDCSSWYWPWWLSFQLFWPTTLLLASWTVGGTPEE